MREARGGSSWVVTAFLGCLSACSSSGTVLETRHGAPPAERDGGTASTTETDAGTPANVDSGTWRSGSRIRVSGYVADGEMLSVNTVHDELRSIDCQVAAAEDGVSRCLPVPREIVYRDADCTDPLIDVVKNASTCPGPAEASSSFVAYKSEQACPKPVVHVVKLGASVDPPEKLYRFNLGICQESSPEPGEYYSAVPSPPTDWVAFESTVRTVTPELGVVLLSGADGSRLVGEMRDLPKNIPCAPQGNFVGAPNPDRVFHCLPTNTQLLQGGALFSDSECTTSVAIAPDCDPPVLTSATVSLDPQTCSTDIYEYFTPGDVVPSSHVYTNLLGPCRVAEAILGGLTAYSKGTLVDPATYPSLTRAPTGSGRVQPWMWQASGIATGVANDDVWTDRATGESVSAMTFNDGVRRGVFSTYTFTDPFYADSACTKPIYGAQRPYPGSLPALCDESPTRRWIAFTDQLDPSGQICGNDHQPLVRPVGSLHSGPVYTTIANYNAKGTNACSQYLSSKSAYQYDFYDLGDAIPASSVFAEIRTVDL